MEREFSCYVITFEAVKACTPFIKDTTAGALDRGEFWFQAFCGYMGSDYTTGSHNANVAYKKIYEYVARGEPEDRFHRSYRPPLKPALVLLYTPDPLIYGQIVPSPSTPPVMSSLATLPIRISLPASSRL